MRTIRIWRIVGKSSLLIEKLYEAGICDGVRIVDIGIHYKQDKEAFQSIVRRNL